MRTRIFLFVSVGRAPNPLNTGDTALLGVGWGVMHRSVMETSCTFRTGVLPEKEREREREEPPLEVFFCSLLGERRGEEETAKVDVCP